MKKMLHIFVGSIVLAAILNLSALAQSQERVETVANIAATGSEINWQPQVAYGSLVLTVSTPTGDVIRREFKAGTLPTLKLTDKKGSKLPDGQYAYQLIVIPELSESVRAALQAGREAGDGAETVRGLQRSGQLPMQTLAQSGFFRIDKGEVFVGAPSEGAEPRSPGAPNRQVNPQSRKRGGSGDGGFVPLDQVIADDLIVQGSACVGLDCVNNESFGFDTIRLKENNTRIKFDDTSTSAGFPANDWQLTANDSASGGANKFSIEDITGAKVPFTITAGAPTNSVFVDSTGRLGLRTSTPVLDVHAATSNTPAFRLEQNNSGGFTAQTWDIAGNEANFFVRDVTGGSRLPFRIRPGAPTSSIDINATGLVGVGTASPNSNIHVLGSTDTFTLIRVQNPTVAVNTQAGVAVQSDAAGADYKAHSSARTLSRWGVTLGGWVEFLQTGGNGLALGTLGASPLILGTNSANKLIISSTGNIGIGGVASPSNPLEHTSGARLTAGGVWTDASSRTLKTNIHGLTAREAFNAVLQLNPVQFEYKAQPGQHYVGFIAEDVPELVATSDRKSLSPMDIVAVLTKVVQEQQKTITDLQQRMTQLEKHKAKKVRLVRRNAR